MNLLKQPIRGQDCHGAGYFGAPRGDKTHRGLDFVCAVTDEVNPVICGVVTKIGYPYDPSDKKKGHLRYVEVETDGYRIRYHYIKPTVSEGMKVKSSYILGFPQDLTKIYPGITQHIHFEVIDHTGKYINPADLFEELQNS